MKNLHIFSLTLLFTTSICIKANDNVMPTFDAMQAFTKLLAGDSNVLELIKDNEVAQKLLAILNNANIDEAMRAEVETTIKNAVEKAKENITQDMSDIKIAAAFNSIIVVADKMLKSAHMEEFRAWLKDVKRSAQVNMVHKLIMGLSPGEFAKTTHYTNPYTESFGFTVNDWLLNKLANIIVATGVLNSLTTMVGADNVSDTVKSWAKRVVVGIVAHLTWGLEKNLLANIRG